MNEIIKSFASALEREAAAWRRYAENDNHTDAENVVAQNELDNACAKRDEIEIEIKTNGYR